MTLKPITPNNMSRRVLPGEIVTSWVSVGEYKDILLDISPEGIARVAIIVLRKEMLFDLKQFQNFVMHLLE